HSAPMFRAMSATCATAATDSCFAPPCCGVALVALLGGEGRYLCQVSTKSDLLYPLGVELPHRIVFDLMPYWRSRYASPRSSIGLPRRSPQGDSSISHNF